MNSHPAKRVLDVGQCNPDHSAIRSMLERRFGAEVVRAHQLTDALEQLRAGAFNLVLVNRKLDVDYSEGLDILRHLKADPELRSVPVMIVTNYPEHDQVAVAAGAESGFGKAQLQDAKTHEKLARFLA
ncbi:MAG TPA: response regulator [Pirellulales bacterium]|jgi:two-component system chemotaxis response regulator CheY|nr:response regulator [Pirellulales bacterium]